MKKKHLIYYIVAVVLPILASCRKELCYNHFAAVELSLSWEQEWERDYGLSHSANWNEQLYGYRYDDLRPVMPEWVMLVKYSDLEDPEETSLSTDGGEFMVNPAASQSYLLYNGDTEYIIISDMASLNDARASSTTRSRSSLSVMEKQYPGVRTTNPPDMLYSTFIENVPKAETHQVTPVPAKMQPLVYTYVIRYEFEYGIQHVALARGALGGLAESVFLRNGVTSDQESIVLYDCDVKTYGCEAQVRSFGIPGFPDSYYGRADGEAAKKHKFTLNLEVMLTSGNMLEFNYDVSDQLEKQPRGGVITISGIRIEDEQNAVPSGFDVEINGWGEHEDIDLPVGSED